MLQGDRHRSAPDFGAFLWLDRGVWRQVGGLAGHEPGGGRWDQGDEGGGGSGTVGDLELAEDVADVAFDGVLGDHELPGDLFIRMPDGDEAEHLPLARTEEGLESVLLAAAIVAEKVVGCEGGIIAVPGFKSGHIVHRPVDGGDHTVKADLMVQDERSAGIHPSGEPEAGGTGAHEDNGRSVELSEDASGGSRRLHGEAGFKYYGVQPMDVGTGAGAKDIGLHDNLDVLRLLQQGSDAHPGN